MGNEGGKGKNPEQRPELGKRNDEMGKEGKI